MGFSLANKVLLAIPATSPKPARGPICVQESGLRFYRPEIGRWVSRDPIEEVGGVNVNGFVFNNPINISDTDGRRTIGEGIKCVLRKICGKVVRICAPGPITEPIFPPVCNPQNFVEVGIVQVTISCPLHWGGASPMSSGGWLLICHYSPCTKTTEHIPGPEYQDLEGSISTQPAPPVTITEFKDQCPEPTCPPLYEKNWEYPWWQDFS